MTFFVVCVSSAELSLHGVRNQQKPQNMFGPKKDNWFHGEFSKIMIRDEFLCFHDWTKNPTSSAATPKKIVSLQMDEHLWAWLHVTVFKRQWACTPGRNYIRQGVGGVGVYKIRPRTCWVASVCGWCDSPCPQSIPLLYQFKVYLPNKVAPWKDSLKPQVSMCGLSLSVPKTPRSQSTRPY